MKTKPLFIWFVGAVLVMTAFIIWRVNDKEVMAQKVVLAKETHKVLNYLMLDLREAKQSSLKGMPADGQWHSNIAFAHSSGPIQYVIKNGELNRHAQGKVTPIAKSIESLYFLRRSNDPAIIQVQIKAKNQSSLISNFKIRMQD
jgi:hypothetical protein